MSTVIAQMDAMDLNSRRDDDGDDEDDDYWDTNVNGWGSPKDYIDDMDCDCDAQGDPSLAKEINHPSALYSSSSNEKEVNESKLPSNSLDNNTRPLTCPGCRMDFKSYFEFVLHIEKRLCMASVCYIEDQLKACTLASSGRA